MNKRMKEIANTLELDDSHIIQYIEISMIIGQNTLFF